MLIDIAALSHIGRRKEKNEDSYGIYDEREPGLRLFKQGMLVAVADGLGGHIGGDIASKLAVSLVKDMIKEDPPNEADRDSEREDTYYLELLEKLMLRANDSIYKTNLDLVKGKRPMGTTLCLALIRPNHVYLGNVGDSRAYLFRNGRFIAQTEDHSWVDEQVKQGLMTQAEAEKDKRKNLLTRSIGTHPEIEIDTYQWRIESGDQLLLCSDGLINMVPDGSIAQVLARAEMAQEKAETLVDMANENGGRDNITVVLATINPNKRELQRLKRAAWFHANEQKIKNRIYIALYGIVCLLVGYVLGVISSP